MRKLPTILHEHANLTDTPWFQKVADRLLEPSTDLAIAVSRSTADFVERARLVPREKIKVVYLGAPLEEFGRPRSADEIGAARAAIGASPDDFAIGTITRLHDSKGNEFLVEAAAKVVSAHPRARFYLAGEGPLREPLEAQAKALGLADRFVFLGFQKDVAETLSAFDLSVFPSLWEGTPLTAFETLAMGKAIVATDADGLLDVLERDVTAWIVPRRDATALAGAISYALTHPDERGAMASRARQAGRQYDIAMFVRKMERLYTLLHEVSRPTRRQGILREDLSFLTTGVGV
jgi:glycosyltransferase involved in cell wall biosynthesis